MFNGVDLALLSRKWLSYRREWDDGRWVVVGVGCASGSSDVKFFFLFKPNHIILLAVFLFED